MLKHIPNILSPDVLKILMEMEPEDEIVSADGNSPAASIAEKLIRLDGHYVPEVLKGILEFFPLDTYVQKPVALMAVTPGDNIDPAIWEVYRKILRDSKEPFTEFEYIEQFKFYERGEKSYAVIATSEPALYANIILKKLER